MTGPDIDVMASLADIARSKLGWHGPLTRETRLVDGLALDSLRQLTLVVEVEDRFRVCLDERDEAAVETVGDLVDLIRRKRREDQPHTR
jgi:acyl carrier protein